MSPSGRIVKSISFVTAQVLPPFIVNANQAELVNEMMNFWPRGNVYVVYISPSE